MCWNVKGDVIASSIQKQKGLTEIIHMNKHAFINNDRTYLLR